MRRRPCGSTIFAQWPEYQRRSLSRTRIGGAARTFTYTVTVFDPARAGADTVLPTLNNPAAGTYQFDAVSGAISYRWTVRATTPFATRPDAEGAHQRGGAGSSGEFIVTRTGNPAGTITVLYTVKGGAAGGVGDGTSKRQIKLTLQAEDGYTVSEEAGAAKVKIVR